MGLIPICQFWGDINPIIYDLAEVNLKALMIEESKKGFNIDVVKIREKIGERLCAFGNLDSINLLNRRNPGGYKKRNIKAVTRCQI